MSVVAHEPIEEIASTGQYSDSVMSRWIFANGIHCIDLIRYFVGDVDEVSSMSENQNYAAVLFSRSVFTTFWIYLNARSTSVDNQQNNII